MTFRGLCFLFKYSFDGFLIFSLIRFGQSACGMMVLTGWFVCNFGVLGKSFREVFLRVFKLFFG